MADVTLFGIKLALATLATLFFVPVVFSVLRRKGAPRRRFEEDGMRVPQSV